MEKINWKVLIVCIIVCQLAGVIGSIFTFSAIPVWYATLQKPSFSPPNWLFGPVWLTLYTMMGISLYLIWIVKLKDVAIKIFGLQLALNVLWSIIFFGVKNLGLAFVEIIFLDASIIASIYYFYKLDRRAAYLLIPYVLWVSFAAFLNYTVWMLNP